ncbi:cation transporter, partial [Halodesulfovibrio aestuarii]
MSENVKRVDQIVAVSKVTWVGLIVNVLLSGLKIAAGIMGNSRAVTADGIHSLSD